MEGSADNLQAIDTGSHWRGRAGPVFAGNLSFENVHFRVGGRQILEDITFNLKPGGIACLLGPSGCGKSTLLKLAAGVERPSAGRILLDGAEVAGPSRFVPPEKRSIGMMFQDFALFPHMTALENVAFGLTALSRAESRRVAMLALERVGLGNLAGSYPAMLSGGEQQRVALARAIVPRPQVILMDEPFSSLDQRLKEAVRTDTLSILRETRATAVLVTHDPQEAMSFADVIYLMREGRIIQQGTPADLQKHPVDAGAARFFRSYNEFSGTVRKGQVTTALGRVPAKGIADGGQAIVLVPPEDVRLLPAGDEPMAQVIESRYVGPHWHVTLRRLETGDEISAYVVGQEPPPQGEDCDLAIAPSNTHIFAA